MQRDDREKEAEKGSGHQLPEETSLEIPQEPRVDEGATRPHDGGGDPAQGTPCNNTACPVDEQWPVLVTNTHVTPRMEADDSDGKGTAAGLGTGDRKRKGPMAQKQHDKDALVRGLRQKLLAPTPEPFLLEEATTDRSPDCILHVFEGMAEKIEVALEENAERLGEEYLNSEISKIKGKLRKTRKKAWRAELKEQLSDKEWVLEHRRHLAMIQVIVEEPQAIHSLRKEEDGWTGKVWVSPTRVDVVEFEDLFVTTLLVPTSYTDERFRQGKLAVLGKYDLQHNVSETHFRHIRQVTEDTFEVKDAFGTSAIVPAEWAEENIKKRAVSSARDLFAKGVTNLFVPLGPTSAAKPPPRSFPNSRRAFAVRYRGSRRFDRGSRRFDPETIARGNHHRSTPEVLGLPSERKNQGCRPGGEARVRSAMSFVEPPPQREFQPSGGELPLIKFRNEKVMGEGHCMRYSLASALAYVGLEGVALAVASDPMCDGVSDIKGSLTRAGLVTKPLPEERARTNRRPIPVLVYNATVQQPGPDGQKGKRVNYDPLKLHHRICNPVVACLKAVKRERGREVPHNINHCVCFLGSLMFDSNQKATVMLDRHALDAAVALVEPGCEYGGLWWAREVILWPREKR